MIASDVSFLTIFDSAALVTMTFAVGNEAIPKQKPTLQSEPLR
jgi:hypothetical protein